ncbi:hypothetical protein LINPERPRIM_LOCUS28205 [Linum perenne]
MEKGAPAMKLTFVLAILVVFAAGMVMKVAEGRGPIVSFQCKTVLDCTKFCKGCKVCGCRNSLCTCIANATEVNPPASVGSADVHDLH